MLKEETTANDTEIRALADQEIDDVNGGIWGAVIVAGAAVVVGYFLLQAARRD
jgi:lactobin A/cerein 7B family class IIb bacteriocin